MARFDLLLELCLRQRAKTAASAARAALGETSLQQAVAGEPTNPKKMTTKSWRGDKGPPALFNEPVTMKIDTSGQVLRT